MQLNPGTLLQGGKYRIIRVLGQGGFGITYEAEQVLLRRKVALKEFFMKDCCERVIGSDRVRAGAGSQRPVVEKFRAKFIKEAQMIARMDHPNIVRVTDVFEENETAYYVMNELSGSSLYSLVAFRGPLPEEDAEKYIREVAGALAYIHSLSTVHLDVKPSNILLNSRGEAVLIDFGISKHYDSAGEQTSSTPVGISRGFAPLEQGRDGDVSQFQPPTDIYALGATLYYLVSGTVPPEASIVAEDGIPRPAGLSNRLWNAISQAMKPFRRDRPQSIEDFLSLLDSYTLTDSISEVFSHQVFDKEGDDDDTSLMRESRGVLNEHMWVDLGLPSGLKWATCNVGALSHCDCGTYFAWGETELKECYDWKSYKFQKYSNALEYVSLSKYNSDSEKGTVDGKIRLDLQDDAAGKVWGSGWRIPTKAEQDELRHYCNWTWIVLDGVSGYRVVGKNGNSIFLPVAGYKAKSILKDEGRCGYYWSSSLYPSRSDFASYLYFHSEGSGYGHGSRSYGRSIRAVTE